MIRFCRISAFLILLSFSACVKEEDFDFTDISVSTWRPEVALPLVNASLDYGDISGTSGAEQLIVDETGRITIFRRSQIYERSGKSFFSIPDQQYSFSYSLSPAQSGSLNLTGVFTDSVGQSFPFTLSTGQRLDRAYLSSGLLEIKVDNLLPYSCSLSVSIPALTKLFVPFVKQMVIPAYTSNLVEIVDLTGNILDLTAANPSGQLQIGYKFTVAGTGASVSAGLAFDIGAEVRSLDYSLLEGSVGQVDFQVPLDTVELDLYGNDPSDSYVFSDPRLYIDIENSIGIPAQLTNCLVQPVRDDGTPVNGSLIPLTAVYPIAYPVAPGLSSNTLIEINAQNSSIVSSYAARPAYVVYRADAGLNRPQPAAINYITDSSRVRINLQSELPLDGYANRLTIRDTAELNLNSIGELDSAVFRIETRNGMPVSGRLQIFFLQNGVVTDSLFHTNDFYLVEATAVDANGFAVGANIKLHDEPLGQERLQRIYDADTVVMRAIMNTTSPPNRVVIRQNDRLVIKLGVRASLKVDD